MTYGDTSDTKVVKLTILLFSVFVCGAETNAEQFLEDQIREESVQWRTRGLCVVNVAAFQLQIGVTMVTTGRVDAVFVGDDLPELKQTNKILAYAKIEGFLPLEL